MQTIAKAEGRKLDGGNPNAKAPDGSMKAVWGSSQQVAACNSALLALSGARIAGFRDPINETERRQEKVFLSACLGAPDPRVASRLGRLVHNGSTLCTVFFLSPTSALTARHCLYDRNRGALALDPRASSMKTLAVEFGPVIEGVAIPVAAVFVPTPQGQYARHALTAESAYSLPRIPVATSDVEQQDYIVIELEKPYTVERLEPVRLAQPQYGDKVFLPAFHEPTRVEGIVGDTGFRQQIAGYCQIVQPQVDRCMTHACSTTPGVSGAPMFVERDIGGRAVLHLIGVHTSGKREATGCPGNPVTDMILNYGVRLGFNELRLF